jgi:hypothetical protein
LPSVFNSAVKKIENKGPRADAYTPSSSIGNSVIFGGAHVDFEQNIASLQNRAVLHQALGASQERSFQK